MTRKTKSIKSEYEQHAQEVLRQQARLKEIEELHRLAVEEEKAQFEQLVSDIDEMCAGQGMFCGVILTPEDLANIVKLAIETKEPIKIKYNLYYNE